MRNSLPWPRPHQSGSAADALVRYHPVSLSSASEREEKTDDESYSAAEISLVATSGAKWTSLLGGSCACTQRSTTASESVSFFGVADPECLASRAYLGEGDARDKGLRDLQPRWRERPLVGV